MKDTYEKYELTKNGKNVVEEFHKVDLLFHPYTARDDFLVYSDFSPIDEYDYFF